MGKNSKPFTPPFINLRCDFSGDKKTIFLVNSVPLVTQQRDYLARNLDLNVRGLCGVDGVDYWKKDQWNEVFKKNQVVCQFWYN